jgi:hypothetical protein
LVIVPSTSAPLPNKVVELPVELLHHPALAVGGWLVAAFTVTVTLSVPIAPPLFVTVSLNTYIPVTRFVSVVVAALAVQT